MPIEVSTHVFIPRPREQVFEAAFGSNDGLVKYFTGFPPLIPAIVGVTVQGGGPTRVDALRDVKMGDGSMIVERVLAHEPPARHGYEAAQMNPLQRLLCRRMVAEWRFEAQGSGTRVTWHYAIHPKTLRGPLAHVVAALLKRAMQRCLDNLAADLA